MIPYSNLFFFYVIGLILLPGILLGVMEKRLKLYGLLASLLIIGLLFSDSKLQLFCLVLFYLGELFLVKGYSFLRQKYPQRWILWLAVLLALLPLALSKWGHLFTDRFLGFLGISYLTFKVVQMLLEISDGLIKEVRLLDFTYFLLFFPTLSSGPIDRSRRFLEEVNQIIPRDEYLHRVYLGLRKLLLGAGYKFIIGNIIYIYWLSKIPTEAYDLVETVKYMYGYSFYLFFDFAGYSLMAIGISYILGVRTPENFNKPFISKDIKDFWNRWHMTLSFWFRDYLYTRFVMASMKKKRFKNRYTASYLGYLLTMGTMGIWHGTEIYYILYGLYHGVLIISTDYFQRHSTLYKKYKNYPLWTAASTLITFNLVCFGFLIFSGYLFK
ncbi:D-alanyl-lipoteichoic acid biosynthesis protein DltB [Desulfitobacterium dehalogenans ATCC 51507]|uniref:Teichoic acid D-alanyltransferase n=1 Tax=Desulfitobacterium dehalogenans (strain ATCC 51507 / DSM 9161 / JW/IU-DC1) TaxID=756499 RepID=I4A3U3_DESDJ|nr:D-alanyl-lipoteichoic acid biosynthesis protein DltB [Desulfitobacterium dehalogenans]AFL98627.1 D-alanyl-lipoteichoic acid biosynthesis protein DltB [Desulfitobacterium dehalogenans ATCC 51507]